MKTHHYVFLFVFALFIFKNYTLSSANLISDQSALLAFKDSISDPNAILSNWSTNTSICDWTGVSCSSKHQRVIALNVSGFALGGNLAPHLGNLTFLRTLDISYNSFTGFIPSELSNLRRLRYINLGANNFAGEIPSWFDALSELEYMHLNNNSFSGRIPASLFNISSLIQINMGFNNISGELPNDMCSNTPKLNALYLSSNQIEGEIPANIYKCRELADLRLATNRISGNIPSEIGSLSMLTLLNLGNNQLVGSILEQFGNLTSLQSLNLGTNNLTGTLPKQLGNMTSLINLDLSFNELTGSIPEQFGYMTSLQTLQLGSNRLAGKLPEELGKLGRIEALGIPFNELNGSIPSAIFNISTLRRLGLQQNNLSGTLPPNMGTSLINLQGIYLFLNKLTGEIPKSINNATSLVIIELNRNFFTGPVPDLGQLRFLQHLKIWENKLSGAESPTQEIPFLSSLNSPNLVSVEMTDNPQMSGIIPASIGNFSSLQFFVASRCDITGPIPPEFGNISSLLGLHLSENQLTGFIPTTLGELKKLQRLYLGDNRLQLDIPRVLCPMSSLGELNLSSNMVTGSLPDCLGELKSLREIAFASNKLTSVIPPKLWDITDLTFLDLSSNNLSGQISTQVQNLKTISQLDLSSNQFSGEIPSSIGGCRSLVFLNLSNNILTGSMPKSLEDLLSLKKFDVSYNKLQGEIPNGGPFPNFTAQSFLHNSALCGDARFQVPSCSHGGSDIIGRLVKYIVPPLVAIIILVVIIVIFIRRRKQKKMPPPVYDLEAAIWRRISYIELERGTSSFSETNLLGRGSFGSVFKGVLSDGLDVAVKVFNLDLEGATRSFDAESEILSSIRHRNLVRIIGCCVNAESRALILAYMPNGNLENWLYSHSYFLDLVQRLQIAMDVALALEYLHHHHTFVVVHCDIKPSNVLLNEDMIAHVADFGVSKLFDEGQVMVHTKTLATIGYAAPEYGSEGKISTSGDVYSYGILLFEMFTQKRPTDDMFSEEMSLKDWVNEALQDNGVSEVVVPGLLSQEDPNFDSKLQCVSSVFHLAMNCVAFSPDERINMVQVVVALQKIKTKVTEEEEASHMRSRR